MVNFTRSSEVREKLNIEILDNSTINCTCLSKQTNKVYFINKDLLAVLTPLECHALNKQTNAGVHARISSMSVQATWGACREVNACVKATMLCRSKVPPTAQTCPHHRRRTPQASRKHAPPSRLPSPNGLLSTVTGSPAPPSPSPPSSPAVLLHVFQRGAFQTESRRNMQRRPAAVAMEQKTKND